jgi:sporulation protein YlmC with PRC-barrel domain
VTGAPDTWLTEVIGRRVLSSDGTDVGRVADLSVRLGVPRPSVVRALVRRPRGEAHLLPAPAVRLVATHAEVSPGTDLAGLEVDARHLPLADDELLLARDVLDTQVVDLRGRHLSRVSDVRLRQVGDGLEVLAVDLGVPGLLRRLGLRVPGGRLELEWHHLHLTSPRGHVVQLNTDTAAFRRLDPSGLAELLSRLSTSRAVDVVRALEPARAAAALHHSHPRTGRRIVQGLSTAERSDLAAGASGDHARTIRRLGQHVSPLQARRYRRTEGWRVHRPPATGP